MTAGGPLWTQFGLKVSRTQLTWLITAGFVLMTLAIGILGIQASWQRNRLKLEDQLKQQQNRSQLLSDIDRQKQQLKKLEQTLLLPGGPTALTSEVTRLAAKTGLQIESVIPQPEANFGPFSRFQIQVVSTYNFPDLIQFLRLLDQHEPLLKADLIELGEPSLQEALPTRPNRDRPAVSLLEPIRQKGKLLLGAFIRREKAR